MQLQLDDIQANVEVSGYGAPLVLLHGSFCNALMWRPQMDLAKRHQLIAVDIRGHGGTPCPVTGRSFDRPLDVIQILDELGIRKAFFCGLSMGGPIAIQLALDYPERCLGIILLATGPGPADRPIIATQEMKDNAEREARRVIDLGPVEYFNALQAVEAPGIKEFLEQPEHRTFFEKVLAQNNPEWLANWFRLGAIDVPHDQLRQLTSRRKQRLQEIDKPVLFMVGDLDKVFLPVADLLRDRISNCTIEVIAGATHMINIDSADRVNSSIQRFTDRVMEQSM